MGGEIGGRGNGSSWGGGMDGGNQVRGMRKGGAEEMGERGEG